MSTLKKHTPFMVSIFGVLGCLFIVSLFFNYKFSQKVKGFRGVIARHLATPASDNNGLPKAVKGFMVTDHNGLRFLAPSSDTCISRSLLCYGSWEPGIQRLLRRIVRPGAHVVCLGGHIGTHALLISRLVGHTGHVDIFEPNPHILPFLRTNIVLNDATNIKLYPLAAFSQKTTLSFKPNDHNTGGSHVDQAQGQAQKGTMKQNLTIQAINLDALPTLKGPIDVLQMDIEGCEQEAVHGMKDLIEASPHLVVIQEWTPRLLNNPRAYLTFWRKKGYDVARIDGHNLTLVSDEELTKPDLAQWDIILAKNLPL